MRKKKFVLPPTRTERFLELYLKTGNATESAMQVFNCTSRASAQAMGSYYLKKSKPEVRMIMEEMGLTFGKLIDIAIEKMGKSSNPLPWFDRLMRIGGYDVMTV